MKYKYTKACDHRGAQMGRPNIMTEPNIKAKFSLQQIPMVSQGAYDPGGAYWGCGTKLWVAFTEGEEEQQECFVRAGTRDEAKSLVRETFPNATFWR